MWLCVSMPIVPDTIEATFGSISSVAPAQNGMSVIPALKVPMVAKKSRRE
jgi:hypothetical protein